MIYKSSYFSKELRQVYLDTRISIRKKLAFALFLGLIAFVVYFMLQPLKESVLFDTVPMIMQPSYFSTLSIYLQVALLLNTLYFIVYYDALFFHEIRMNSWYLLVKMGYHPALMIFSKLAALLFSVVLIYTTGFLCSACLTYFLKYTLVTAYFPALYLAGLIDLIIITTVAMALSPFIHTVGSARYSIFASLILLWLLKNRLGYDVLISNRAAMQNMANLFDFNRSLFLPVAGALTLGCVLACILKARNIARYYNLPGDQYAHVLPAPPLTVVLVDSKSGRRKPVDNRDRIARRSRRFDLATTAFLIVFIVAALALNIVILVINASTFGKEVSIHGIIPYVFKSTTMEPAIMLHDLAYFKQWGHDQEIEIGQIILFEENHVIYVERVTAKTEGRFEVDIDRYPPGSQAGAMIKTVAREAVLGVYHGRNRWLGALILFANTIFGRLLFLLVPALLLFFQKPVTDRFAKRTWAG